MESMVVRDEQQSESGEGLGLTARFDFVCLREKSKT